MCFAVPGARLAKVETTQQLAHKEDVRTVNHFWLQPRIRRQCRMRKRRTQIGKSTERLSNLQQPGLRPLVRRQRVELISADRAQQNSIAFKGRIQRGCGQRSALRLDGNAANQRLTELKIMPAQLCDGTQNAKGLAGYFRPNAISGNNKNLQLHPMRFSNNFRGESPSGLSLCFTD